MPRDPNRIPEILTLVQKAWVQFPDQRFGQLIANVIGPDADLFNIEDDVMLDDLKEWLDSWKNWRPRDDKPDS